MAWPTISDGGGVGKGLLMWGKRLLPSAFFVALIWNFQQLDVLVQT